MYIPKESATFSSCRFNFFLTFLIPNSRYEDDFWDVWQNRFELYRNREWMKTGVCAQCSHWRYCEGNGMHLRDSQGKLMQCHLMSNEMKKLSHR